MRLGNCYYMYMSTHTEFASYGNLHLYEGDRAGNFTRRIYALLRENVLTVWRSILICWVCCSVRIYFRVETHTYGHSKEVRL